MQTSMLNLGQIFATGSAYSTTSGTMRIPAVSLRKNSEGKEIKRSLCINVPAAVWGSFIANNGRLQKGDALEITADDFRVEPKNHYDADFIIHTATIHRAPPRWEQKPAKTPVQYAQAATN